MAALPHVAAVVLIALHGFVHATVDGNAAFDSYILAQKREYRRGSEEYTMRLPIFQLRLTAIEKQNAQPQKLWTAGMNDFTDRTDTELLAYRGWRHMGGKKSAGSGEGGPSLASPSLSEEAPLPTSFDWSHLATAKFVRNQGECGSCWAVAAAGILESHHEIYRKEVKRFSPQELVTCTTNPHHCGGKGGCSGATAELAFEQALKHGIRREDEFPYTGKEPPSRSSCPNAEASSLASTHGEGNTNGGAAVGLIGWRRLPENKEEPLIRALVRHGPVAVSVAAADHFDYSGGVLDSCPKDSVLDHAVALYGYGQVEDAGGSSKKYWLLRNSWGDSWGEAGYVRLLRHADEESYCGTDNDPQQGSGCDGGPKEITICGSCGILYDTSIPIFAGAETEAEIKTGKSLAAQKPRGSKVFAVISSDARSSFVREDRR